MPLAVSDITFRNTTGDFSGKGSPLTSLEGDYNEFKQASAIVALQDSMAAVGAGIASITQPTPTTLLITLTDLTTFGPFTMPTAPMNGRGLWQPSVAYAVNDIVYYGTAFYVVEVAHTSDTTFDAGATDGGANNLYGLIFDIADGGSTVRQSSYKQEANLTHTISALDLGAIWDCTNSAGCAITIPSDSTYDAPLDSEVSFRQGTTLGILTFVPAGGVSLDTGIFQAMTTFQGAVVTLKKVAANTWIGWGYLSA